MFENTKSWEVFHVDLYYFIMYVFAYIIHRLEVISTDNVSTLSKVTKANETCKLLLTQKDLQLKKSQDRYILYIRP